MTAPTATPVGGAGATAGAARIATFMRRCSIEATRPGAADAQILRAVLPQGAEIYLSAVHGRPAEEIVDAARAIRAAGLEPVPHLAVRGYRDIAAVAEAIRRLRRAADVRKLLLIGGDVPTPAGDIVETRQVIDSGVLQGEGIERVGIAGHPDGHPTMTDEELEGALVTKIAAAQSLGLDVHIVTQFCFEPATIVRWIEWLRTRGVNLPVEIGLAGPTSLMTWLNYARRCGVRASAQALARRSGLVKQLFNAVAPDSIIRAVAEANADGHLGDIAPHLFSFGGLKSTARWASAAMRGAFALDAEGGFHVELGQAGDPATGPAAKA